ncbi:MAG: hypothetical protein Q9202_004724 [Teloschistes flavicans]
MASSKKPNERGNLSALPLVGRAYEKAVLGPSPPAKLDRLSAEVAKVQQVGSTTYNGGRGYQTQFEYSPSPNPARKCYLVVEGGLSKLTLTLQVNNSFRDPNPEILHRFEIPTENARVGLRLYKKRLWMEVHVDPKRQGKQKPVGDHWSIRFRGRNDGERESSRRILQRLESTTRQQPDLWFGYRNFFTGTGFRAGETRPETDGEGVIPGQYCHDLSSGNRWTFHGNLATAGFLEALNVPVARPIAAAVDQPLVSQPRLTRSMARPEAYSFSSLPSEPSVSLQTIRKMGVAALAALGENVKKVPRQRIMELGQEKALEKREAARAKKAEKVFRGKLKAPVTKSRIPRRPKTLSFEPLEMAEREPRQSITVVPPKIGALKPAAASNIGALNQAAASNQNQIELSSEDSSDSEEGSQGSNDGITDVEYPIEAILDDGENSDGEMMYLVDWEGDYEPSWQPEADLSAEALSAWLEKKQAQSGSKKRKASTRGKGKKKRAKK